ncbi:MAG: transposase [Gemmiger sp.]|uniref:transposase n=1 Tax=Gemmiger sp. TaxID=2049027 RepID=UPI00300EAA3C
MAHAEKITFQEFRTRFSTEDACRTELFRLRFPNGFVCPRCGCTEYYPVRGRNSIV